MKDSLIICLGQHQPQHYWCQPVTKKIYQTAERQPKQDQNKGPFDHLMSTHTSPHPLKEWSKGGHDSREILAESDEYASWHYLLTRTAKANIYQYPTIFLHQQRIQTKKRLCPEHFYPTPASVINKTVRTYLAITNEPTNTPMNQPELGLLQPPHQESVPKLKMIHQLTKQHRP